MVPGIRPSNPIGYLELRQLSTQAEGIKGASPSPQGSVELSSERFSGFGRVEPSSVEFREVQLGCIRTSFEEKLPLKALISILYIV